MTKPYVYEPPPYPRGSAEEDKAFDELQNAARKLAGLGWLTYEIEDAVKEAIHND